jgi:hypothetical protein
VGLLDVSTQFLKLKQQANQPTNYQQSIHHQLTRMVLAYNSLSYLVYAAASASKRPYLKDYKPFSDLYTPKSITTVFSLSALIPLNKVILEFNQHMDDSENDPADFKWEETIMRHMPEFISQFQRNTCVAIIKKLCEMWALENLPMRLTDKLTKDLYKSFERKLARLGHVEAASAIFSTAIWNSTFYVVANVIYDVSTIIATGVMDYSKSKQSNQTILNRVKQLVLVQTPTSFLAIAKRSSISILKKCGYWMVFALSSACGYSFGSYVHVKHGGWVFKILFELGGGLTYSALVGI